MPGAALAGGLVQDVGGGGADEGAAEEVPEAGEPTLADTGAELGGVGFAAVVCQGGDEVGDVVGAAVVNLHTNKPTYR